jgi:ubiquinone/menaquinone biosynthesis C-methylase UbiE
MRTDETAGREANNEEYALGHSELELKRLILQAGILRDITERLLRDAGLRQGMRVLDLGSGTGDVSMLAADIVGPSGSVVGIDRNQRTVELAQRRASEAGYSQLRSMVLGPRLDCQPYDVSDAPGNPLHKQVTIHRAAERARKSFGVLACQIR